MRRINRGAVPESLTKNAATWTADLLQAIADGIATDAHYDHYRKQDVKSQLRHDAHFKCMYCEDEIGASNYPNIEHIRPKRGATPFPELTFDWTNLGWACEPCNRKKGTKWNHETPILDPYTDPVEDHLQGSFGLIVPRGGSPRGAYTIDAVRLRRGGLVLSRARYMARVWKDLQFRVQHFGWDSPEVEEYVADVTAPQQRYSLHVRDTIAVLRALGAT